MTDQNKGFETKEIQVMPVKTFLVKYPDGNTGEDEVRMGFIVGNDIRFLEKKAMSKPAQEWLRKAIFKSIGRDFEADTEAETSAPVASTSSNQEVQV